MKQAAASSPRIKVDELGKTTNGNPFVSVTIPSSGLLESGWIGGRSHHGQGPRRAARLQPAESCPAAWNVQAAVQRGSLGCHRINPFNRVSFFRSADQNINRIDSLIVRPLFVLFGSILPKLVFVVNAAVAGFVSDARLKSPLSRSCPVFGLKKKLG